MKLYLVKANQTDYDDFDCAVVYATSPADALAVVQAELVKGVYSTAPGRWEPPMDGAELSAVELPVVRGAVLGHAKPC